MPSPSLSRSVGEGTQAHHFPCPQPVIVAVRVGEVDTGHALWQSVNRSLSVSFAFSSSGPLCLWIIVRAGLAQRDSGNPEIDGASAPRYPARHRAAGLIWIPTRVNLLGLRFGETVCSSCSCSIAACDRLLVHKRRRLGLLSSRVTTNEKDHRGTIAPYAARGGGGYQREHDAGIPSHSRCLSRRSANR